MPNLPQTPQTFLDFNQLQSKNLVIVVDIPGLDYLTNISVLTEIRYGDPIFYGDPGLVYGGLRTLGTKPGERGQRNLLSMDGSSLTLSQRLEPEQGRGSISTLSLSFVDLQQYMSRATSPGLIIPDILGADVKIWMGYQQTSFPDDFFIIFRGICTQVNIPTPGLFSLQFSDSQVKKRQELFYTGKTVLFSDILAATTTIPVVENGDFYKKILGPSGIYGSEAKLYIKIEDEYIEYQQIGQEAVGYGTNQFVNVLRGQRGSTPADHAAGTEVDAVIQIQDGAIDMALKLMLSGFGGAYKKGVALSSFCDTGDPSLGIISNALVLPDSVDAVRDYGLSSGDWVTITGATNSSNNGTFQIAFFLDAKGFPNKVIGINSFSFTVESPTSALMALRSQFDVYPIIANNLNIGAGMKLGADEVDVSGHLYYRDTFLGSATNELRFFMTDTESSGKSFLEAEVYLPIGAYSLTRQGLLSMGYTKPPIADQRTVTLSNANVLEPQSINPSRGTNNRKFFNAITWEYDYGDDGNPASQVSTIDSDSLNTIGILSTLPIATRGTRTDLSFQTVRSKRESLILNRYARGAVTINIKTNFGTGNQIEASDVVIVQDQGGLQITNWQTGKRDIGVQLFEVINRSLDLKSGQVQLQLLGGVGANVNDRYATFSPSSVIQTGSTSTRLVISDSFGGIFPLQEFKKWTSYVGYKVNVHSHNWTTRNAFSTNTGFDPTNPNVMIVSPALPFTPLPGDIIDIDLYDTGTDPTFEALYKLVHAHMDATGTVTVGHSPTSFDLSPTDVAKFDVGYTVVVHNRSYSNSSTEVAILSIVGNTVTVASSLGFTPSAGDRVDLGNFADRGGPYRWI